MYADTITDSMREAIEETERRRRIQLAYNEQHRITPQGIQKAIRDLTDRVRALAEPKPEYHVAAAPPDATALPKDELFRLIKDIEAQMKRAAQQLEFEKAAVLRDQLLELRRTLALSEDDPIASAGQRLPRPADTAPARGSGFGAGRSSRRWRRRPGR